MQPGCSGDDGVHRRVGHARGLGPFPLLPKVQIPSPPTSLSCVFPIPSLIRKSEKSSSPSYFAIPFLHYNPFCKNESVPKGKRTSKKFGRGHAEEGEQPPKDRTASRPPQPDQNLKKTQPTKIQTKNLE